MENELILTTNELENSIDYLEKAAYYHRNHNEPYWFKWLTISLHGALYGFGVSAVKGTNPSLRVLDNPSKKRINEIIPYLSERYLGFDDPLPKDYTEVLADEHLLMAIRMLTGDNLNNIWIIIEKCQNPEYMIQNPESQVLVMTPREKLAVEKLIHYRNDFAHFKPKISGVTTSEILIFQEVINVIKFLALSSKNVFYPNNEIEDKVKEVFKKMNNEA